MVNMVSKKGKDSKSKEEIPEEEEKITNLEEKISNLEEEIESKIEKKEKLEEEIKESKNKLKKVNDQCEERSKKREELNKEYENRQVDLTVLNEKVKEKASQIDESRSIITELKKDIEDKKRDQKRQIDDAESIGKKIHSLQAENKAIILKIENNKSELEHSNNLIDVKEEELKLLKDQIEKKELMKKTIDKQIEINRNEFQKMEKQKQDYKEIIDKNLAQLIEKQQVINEIDFKIQVLNGILDSLMGNKIKKEKIIRLNEQMMSNFKKHIDSLNTEYKQRENMFDIVIDKLLKLESEYDNILQEKEKIEKCVNNSQEIHQQLEAILGKEDNKGKKDKENEE